MVRTAGRFGRAERIEILLRHRRNAAVGAHLDDVEPLLGILEHPVLAFELGDHALDRAFHAERLAAADAGERLFLLDDAARGGGGAEIDLRLEADHFLRAGRLAQPALHAGVLGEAQHRPLGIVRQRAGRAGGDAGQAQRAAFDLDLEGAERRALRQRHDIDRRRRHRMQLAQREPHHVALAADGGEGGGLGRAVHGADGAQRAPKRVRIVGLDRCDARAGKAEAGKDRLASAMVWARPAISWRGLARVRKRTADAP